MLYENFVVIFFLSEADSVKEKKTSSFVCGDGATCMRKYVCTSDYLHLICLQLKILYFNKVHLIKYLRTIEDRKLLNKVRDMNVSEDSRI